MFNGILKSDDVEVYEQYWGSGPISIALTNNCKSNIIIACATYSDLELPLSSPIGKVISITVLNSMAGSGKPTIGGGFTCRIKHSATNLFQLAQGTVSFMYVGQQLNGLTATDKAKSGWIILGGVQGDTAITGYSGSVVHGSGAYAGGANAVILGNGASGTGISVGQGSNSAVALGGAFGNAANAAGGTYPSAIGTYCYAATSKVSLKANTIFSANGDAQAGKFILMRQTTDATPLVMSATNAAASTSNILILPNNGTYAFKGTVVAKDGTTLDSAMWEVTALMKRGANASTTALVGTPTITKVFSDAGAAAWTIALTADTTNGGGVITVTGEAGKTIRFVSDINSCEVI